MKAIFHEAVELPRSKQARFLDAECGADVELRADVEELLRSDEGGPTGSGFLDPPTLSAVRGAIEKEESASILGQRVSPWKLVSEIASGGMGVVYLAERADGQFRQ